MIYAVKLSRLVVDLFASESDRTPPPEYTRCNLRGFVHAWRERDRLRFVALAPRTLAERVAP